MNKALEGLRLDRVHIALGGRALLELSEQVAPGEALTVMGPSGSGKSTLLAYVAGFLEPVFEASGRVWLGRRDISILPANERRTGILFQDALLFPHMSVGANLLFAVRPGPRAQRRQMVDAALEDAGLAGFFDRDPETLSGGQKARASLMRVLLSEPHALLLDEPFSKLDRGLRAQMRSFVFERAAARRLPVLLVTHDLEDAEAAGGRIVELA